MVREHTEQHLGLQQSAIWSEKKVSETCPSRVNYNSAILDWFQQYVNHKSDENFEKSDNSIKCKSSDKIQFSGNILSNN